MKKRLVALLTVMVLVLSLSTAAFAAKPTAYLYKSSRNQTVERGDTIEFDFTLRSKSYSKKNDAFRAKLGVVFLYNSKQVGTSSYLWTGIQHYELQAKVAKKAPTGKYTMKYTTYCRTRATANWKKVKTQSAKFTVVK